jgi:hypothetical protein
VLYDPPWTARISSHRARILWLRSIAASREEISLSISEVSIVTFWISNSMGSSPVNVAVDSPVNSPASLAPPKHVSPDREIV